MKANPKITILYQLSGKKAVKEASTLFFPTNQEKKKEWLESLSEQEKKNATFIFYKRRLRTNYVSGFKLIIGDSNEPSILGQETKL